jgi:hypothetical protein
MIVATDGKTRRFGRKWRFATGYDASVYPALAARLWSFVPCTGILVYRTQALLSAPGERIVSAFGPMPARPKLQVTAGWEIGTENHVDGGDNFAAAWTSADDLVSISV